MQAKSTRFIAYFRVSTDRQGKSRLGLEAQQEAVRSYLASVGGAMVAEYTEVETGKLNERPELQKALSAKATLVVGKLDRLSRNVAFLAALMDGKTASSRATIRMRPGSPSISSRQSLNTNEKLSPSGPEMR